eukprot:Rhum_TRINITY_DN22930_c0_g1::Rhum_TRINITY_DN22930_c0_g1_i1::g.176571::m.176571
MWVTTGAGAWAQAFGEATDALFGWLAGGDGERKCLIKGLLREVVSGRYVRWAGAALGVSLCLQGSLALFESRYAATARCVRRMYPCTYKELTSYIAGMPNRVIVHALHDALQMSSLVVFCAALQRVAPSLLPSRFPSYFHLCSAGCGVSFHRLRYILSSCCPPLFQLCFLWPPRGLHPTSSVTEIEQTMTSAELLAVECLQSVGRMAAWQLIVFLRWVTGTLPKTLPASNRSMQFYLAWNACLFVLTPAGYVRSALRIPVRHLFPLIIFADVVHARASMLTWVTAFVIGTYYKTKGWVCSTVLPASYVVLSIYDEMRIEEETRGAWEDMSHGLAGGEEEDGEGGGVVGASELSDDGYGSDRAERLAQLAAGGGAGESESEQEGLRQAQVMMHLFGRALQRNREEALETQSVTARVGNAESLKKLEHEICAICRLDYEIGAQTRTLRCGHFFHQECVDPWLSQRWVCPWCRAPAVVLPSDGAEEGEISPEGLLPGQAEEIVRVVSTLFRDGSPDTDDWTLASQ